MFHKEVLSQVLLSVAPPKLGAVQLLLGRRRSWRPWAERGGPHYWENFMLHKKVPSQILKQIL